MALRQPSSTTTDSERVQSTHYPGAPQPGAPSTPVETAALPWWKRTFESLKERDFRLLWLGMLPSTLAMQMGMVTNGYLAYDITGSAAAVGFVTLGFGVPMLFLSLIGGVVADRFSKRQILMATQSVVGLAAAVLAFLVLTDLIRIWHMTLVAFMMGTAFAFNMPARQAFVAELVGRERLTNAVALNNTGMNMARVVGPAVAGALIGIAFIGIGGVYVIMALMYVAVVYTISRLPDRGVRPTAGSARGFDALKDGLRYILSNQVLRALMILAFAPTLLGMSYQALMPVFAEEVFNVGASGLGFLMTVNGIGALVGSLGVATFSNFRKRGMLQVGLGIVFGLSLATFAFGQSLAIAVPSLVVIGATSAAYMALNMSLVMSYTEPQYHGRVMSINMMTFSLMPLSVVPTGYLVDIFGAPVVIGISGLALTAIVAAYGTLHPSYRKVE
ncbi:MAG TPA: MFS transporter [Thermomicrobiales bacterium]|nr:MFS transporter [Thermomicrobiales bacterium]